MRGRRWKREDQEMRWKMILCSIYMVQWLRIACHGNRTSARLERLIVNIVKFVD
jgi:uncharacterized membrane protein YhdT